MRPERIELRLVRMPLRRPFRTSFGSQDEKEAILVRAQAGGIEGWGECAAGRRPLYSGEWNAGAWIVLRDELAPAALRGEPSPVKGHPMAATALEVALLDLRLRAEGVSLASHLGAVRDTVACGASLGIEDDPDELLAEAALFLERGYHRVKLKIEPGNDLEAVRAVRTAFPDAPLSVDANAAYRPADAEHLAELDAFGLEYVEQPLPADHLLGHADLAERIGTPICLDETLTSAAATAEAIRLEACSIVNLKVGRVGGIEESVRIHDLVREAGVDLWCGGMLETGIGRAVNVALAAMPGMTLPGDTSASDRYFAEDITEPFMVTADGMMRVPEGPGIGVTPIPALLERATVERTEVGP